jgi:hypothetical protein
METPVSVRDAVREGDWATSIDLTDAYFHIPIHRSFRKWLRFMWNGEAFQFRALPFGLSLALWVFYSHRERAVLTRSKQGGSPQGLPRRLAHLGRFQAVVSGSHQFAAGCVTSPRVSVHLSEIESCPSQSFTYLGMDFVTVSFTVRPSLPRVLNSRHFSLVFSRRRWPRLVL